MNLNEETLAFYYRHGLAITQWAHVELALSGLAMDQFSAEDWLRSTKGFHAIENFRSKLQFVSEILSTINLSSHNQTLWSALYDRTEQAAKKRNKLVHYWIMTIPTDKAGRRVKLLPFRPPTKASPKERFPGAICLRDVAAYQQEFSALYVTIERFRMKIGGPGTLLPESQEQPARPPTLAQIRREIYAYASTPPKPSRR